MALVVPDEVRSLQGPALVLATTAAHLVLPSTPPRCPGDFGFCAFKQSPRRCRNAARILKDRKALPAAAAGIPEQPSEKLRAGRLLISSSPERLRGSEREPPFRGWDNRKVWVVWKTHTELWRNGAKQAAVT